MKRNKQTVTDVSGTVIYIVRHGQTEANRERRWIGQSDSPLTQQGVEYSLLYADALARAIPDCSKVQLQSSTLLRARHTADLIGERLGLESHQCSISPLLRELSFGQWEGYTHEEIEVRFPGAQSTRHLAHWTYIIPGGESYQQVNRRVQEWFKLPRLALVTIVVTHAKTSRVLRGIYMGLDPSSVLALKHPQDRFYALRNGKVETIRCGFYAGKIS